METKVVILDAMGGMYSIGDDVRDLLCPFVIEKNGIRDMDRIKELYISASPGNITASDFWESVGISPNLEDEYLQRHKLTDGLIEFIEILNSRGTEVWCLSNDLSEWARKLRIRFELEKYFQGFIISGDVGFRKPDPRIFQHLLKQISVNVSDTVFIDDNPKNLDSAAKLGFKTIIFNTGGTNSSNSEHESASSFREVLRRLSPMLE